MLGFIPVQYRLIAIVGAVLVNASIGAVIGWNVRDGSADRATLAAEQKLDRAVAAGIGSMKASMKAALTQAQTQRQSIADELAKAQAEAAKTNQHFEELTREINDQNFGSCRIGAEFAGMLARISDQANGR